MNSLRTPLALTVTLLTLAGASLAHAHDLPLDVPTAARNLDKAARRLADDLTFEYSGPECVTIAAHELEDSVDHLRTSIYRRASQQHLCSDFRDVVRDFRTLSVHLRKSGMPPVIGRDMLTFKSRLVVLGQLLEGHGPEFGHDCDFGENDHGHHGHEGRIPWGQPRPPVPTPPVIRPAPAPMPRPYPIGPQGGAIGLKFGKVQFQFYSR